MVKSIKSERMYFVLQNIKRIIETNEKYNDAFR